jgi:hypothetical protein
MTPKTVAKLPRVTLVPKNASEFDKNQQRVRVYVCTNVRDEYVLIGYPSTWVHDSDGKLVTLNTSTGQQLPRPLEYRLYAWEKE